MSKFTKLGLFLTFVVVLAMAVPAGLSAVAQGPDYITYNSYASDPLPRAFDEQVVDMWNEANPLMPVEHSIIAHT